MHPAISSWFVFGMMAATAHAAVAGPAVPDDHVVAIVGDRVITVGDLGHVPKEVEREILRDLVDEILLVRYFRSDATRSLPAGAVDAELQQQLASQFDGNREKLAAYLHSIKKSADEYRQLVEDRMIVDSVRAEIRRSAETHISEGQIEDFYAVNRERFYLTDGIHLRLIKLSQVSDENQAVLNQTAETVMQKLRAGADFAMLAKEYSKNSKRSDGGDFGWRARSDLRDELATAAFALDRGQFSEPIKLDRDIFILFVEDKRSAGIQPFEEVRHQIERLLVSQKVREAELHFLEALRRKAKIQCFN